MEPIFFRSAADFRRWLEQRHATARELLVGLHKKNTSRGMTYAEALDEALSFGWIDGVRKRIDEGRYTIRFTPRKPGSIWSAVNIRHAKRLISLKRMAPAGLRAFRERDERRARLYSYERTRVKLAPALARILRANPKAASFFKAQPAGYRKIVTFWVMSAKKRGDSPASPCPPRRALGHWSPHRLAQASPRMTILPRLCSDSGRFLPRSF